MPPAAPQKQVMVRVVVREGENPDVILHDKTGDHNERYFRDWITNTTWWAVRNNKTVHYYPAE